MVSVVVGCVSAAGLPAFAGVCPATLAETWQHAPQTGVDRESPVMRVNRRSQDRYVVAHEQNSDAWQYRCIWGTSYYTADHSVEAYYILSDLPTRDIGYYWWPAIWASSSANNYNWFATWQRTAEPFIDFWDSFGRVFLTSMAPLTAPFVVQEDAADDQTHTSSGMMPASNKVVVVWEEYEPSPSNNRIVRERHFDATGTPISPSSDLSAAFGTSEMWPRIVGFWASEDRYVAAWAATNNDGLYSIEYIIKDEQGAVVAPVSVAVGGLIGLPFFDVAAVGTGFALVYTTNASSEVMFRTFSAEGVPYGSWASISDEAPGVSIYAKWPKITAGLWSPYLYRPVPYFVITWTAQSGVDSRAIRYSLVRGVANPEFLVVGETIAPQYAPSDSWAASAELFTSCTADLRIGFVWSALGSSGTGRYGIKKKILSFTPGRSMLLSGGMATDDTDYDTLGLDEAGVDDELSFVVPELGEECLDEPEVPMLEE